MRGHRLAVRSLLAGTVVVGLAAMLTGCTAPDTGAPGPASSTSRSPLSRSPHHSPLNPPHSSGAAAAPQLLGTVAGGLTSPWSIAMLPDGSALVSERDTGAVEHVQADGSVTSVGTVDGVVPGGEGGLLGLAVSERFATDHYLYAYYTGRTDNRVVRMTFTGGSMGGQYLLLGGIPKASHHDGGRIKFGPDGNLYIGTGDALHPENAQDHNSLSGKILRILPDGGPAPGNPFPDSPVYSVGHRNIEGLAWDSVGRLWASELGPDVDDELNLIKPGGNYGWPEVTGAPGDPRYIDAKAVWPSTADCSPSGIGIVHDVAYVGALRGERLWQVVLHGTDAGQPQSFFRGEFGRIRDVVPAGDGQIWLATDGGKNQTILRVSVLETG